jgi:hypothetical protein
MIVDPEHGMQNFDLVTANEHLHHSEVRGCRPLLSSLVNQIDRSIDRRCVT